MYQEIYRGHGEREIRLKKNILLAYSGFIELAIEATKYYLEIGISMFITPA